MTKSEFLDQYLERLRVYLETSKYLEADLECTSCPLKNNCNRNSIPMEKFVAYCKNRLHEEISDL